MHFLRTSSLIGISLLLLLLLAACGTSSNPSTGGNGANAATTKTDNQEANEYSTPSSSSKPAATKTGASNEAGEYSTPATKNTGASASGTITVKTATAMVKGKSETILTDVKGLTLYYFTPDTKTTAACTSTCASTWPPLLTTGSNTPTSAGALSGKLTALKDDNGMQVQYNNHFLYTYAGDSAPGQTNGEGILGKWFVATANLAES